VFSLLLARGEDEGEESHESAIRTCVLIADSELSVPRWAFDVCFLVIPAQHLSRSSYVMRSAVIFDLDGVLADSEPWWSQIDAKLLAEHGVTYRGEYHQNVVGVSYRLAVEFYKKAFDLSVPTEELMRRRGEIATEFFANRVGLFPDVKEVLEELRQMKLHLAVATSSVSASARPFLDRHQLTGFLK
jgi:hypothetical protein